MKAEIIQAQREIIQGYYTKIGFNPHITVEDIMQMLESDLQYVREETLLLDAKNIINPPTKITTKTLNEEEMEQLDSAFSAACNLSFASDKDNFSTCGSFHIKPFHTDWDKKTVKEVMYNVKLYLDTWIIYPMGKALKKSRSEIMLREKKRHKEARKRFKERNNSNKKANNEKMGN